jgi:hypothetical protein
MPLMDSRQIHWDREAKAFRWGPVGSGQDLIPLNRYSQVKKTQREQIDELMKQQTAGRQAAGVQLICENAGGSYFAEYDRVVREVGTHVVSESQPFGMRATVKTVRSGTLQEKEEPAIVT